MRQARFRGEGGWTREDFLRRAAGAGVAVLGAAPLTETLGRAVDALAAGPADVQRFASRPDLHPVAIEVVRQADSVAPGYLFLTPFQGPGDRGLMILDDAGEVVWWHSTKPRNAMNLRVASWKGRRVLTWWEGRSKQGLGEGECVIADEEYREVARFRAHDRPVDLHEFVITPRGTALVTAHETRRRDLRRFHGPAHGRVVGSVVQELEIPSGRVLFEWRSLDHVALEESHQVMKRGEAFHYFHANSVAPMADGSLLVSARNTWALYKVARPSGRVLWRLGGKRSDFHMGHGTHFYWQHDARSHDGDRLLSVFDDAAGPPAEEKHSRGLLLAVDERRRRVRLERAYTHRPPVLAQYTGSVQLLHNHDVLVGWGSAPYLTEFAHDGSVRLDMRFPKGGASYRALRFPWMGRPRTKPALVAVPNAGSPLLYVSWNGATEVTDWQLLTGSSPTALQPTATMPRSGFETRLAPGLGSGYAAVVALDASGRPLAQSAAVPLA